MMANVTADASLYVEFSGKALQDRYSQRREAAQAGRDSSPRARWPRVAANRPSATRQSRPRSASVSRRYTSQTTGANALPVRSCQR